VQRSPPVVREGIGLGWRDENGNGLAPALDGDAITRFDVSQRLR
jgi:hypothetical protein